MLPPDVSDSAGAVDDLVAEHALDSRDAGGRFLRGSSLRLAAFATGLAAGVGATPLVVNHLGPSGWGRYATVTSLMFVVAAITEGGLGQMGVRELSVGSTSARDNFMRDLLGLRIALTSIGALVALCYSLAAGYEPVVVEGTAIAGAGMLLTNVAGTLALPLTAELRLGWLALTELAAQLMTAVAMVILVAAGAGLLPFYVVPVVAGATSLIATVAVVRHRIPLLPAFRPDRWRALLAQTFVYAIATATGAMYFRIALLATSLLSTKAQTGYFGLSFRVLELTSTVPWLIVSAAFPILARSASNDWERLRYALQRLLQGALILGGWFALCLVVGAPFVIHVLELGAHEFGPAVPVLRILGCAITATFVLATFSYALLSLRLYRQLLIANGAVIVLAVALSGALIPPLGAKGAALVSLALEFTLMFAYVFAIVKAHPTLRPSLAGFERIVLSFVLASAAGWALADHPLIDVLVASAVLAVSLLALRAIPAELFDLVRRRGGR